MKHHLILIALICVWSCKKSNNNSGNSNNSNPNLDSENYFTIDGVTNYHYITASYVPTVSCQTLNGKEYNSWANGNTNSPDYNAGVSLSGLASYFRHSKNGILTFYYPRLWNNLPSKLVNNNTVIEFKDLKAYLNQTDTTKGFVLVSGKFTCNGK